MKRVVKSKSVSAEQQGQRTRTRCERNAMSDQKTEAAAGSGYAGPAGSVFRCVGNIGGCDKKDDDRCVITVRGLPPIHCGEHREELYMCPYNHWRSARWELSPNAEITGPAPDQPEQSTTGDVAGSGESTCWADVQSAKVDK